MKEWPEIVCHRHSMFVPIAFESNGDGLPSLVDVGQNHSQHSMPSSDIIPVADALGCTEEQREDGLVAVGNGSVDELFCLNGIKCLVDFPRHPSPKFSSPSSRKPVSTR